MSGPLKNTRNEAFARELAKGKTQDEAYEAAGYKPDDGHASRLAGNGRIIARVGELQNKAAERLVVTVASLIAEAEEARKGATEAGQFSAAVAAIKEKGVLAGVRVEKKEHRDLSVMGDDELANVLDRLMALEADSTESDRLN